MARTAIHLLTTVVTLVATAQFNSLRAAGTPEQQHACIDDAFKFCSNEIPDVQRVTACMVRNLDKLSPRCRAQFGHSAVASESGRACSSDAWDDECQARRR